MLIQSRVCFACKEEKPISEYYKSNTRYYQRECKACNKLRKAAWHKTDAGKLSSTNTKLKTRFGITLEDYNKMLEDQRGLCLICEESLSYNGHKLSVDHCHTTGKIRGLLCKACNFGLGHFKDNSELLVKAIKYLEDSK
jgi:hypothetical protein